MNRAVGAFVSFVSFVSVVSGCGVPQVAPSTPADSAADSGMSGVDLVEVVDGVYVVHRVFGSAGVEAGDLGDLTVTVDVTAGTASFALDSGEVVEASMTRVPEETFDRCCPLNGSGYTAFETFALSPSTLVLGEVTIEGAVLSAEPAVKNTDSEGVYGYAVSIQLIPEGER